MISLHRVARRIGGLALRTILPTPRVASDALDGHVLLYGLQGSGNVIAQNIIGGVAGQAAPFGWAKRGVLVDHIARVGAFNTIMTRMGPVEKSGIGYAQPWYLNAVMADGDDVATFPAIPSGIVLGVTIWGSHNLPNGDDIRNFASLGGKVAVLLRHPLDVMTAIANKSVSRSTQNHRASRNLLLQDEKFVAEFSYQIEMYWRRLNELRDLVRVFRYEDLLASPKDFIAQVEEFLGKQAPESAIDDLVSKVGTTELGGPGHFFEAKAGGWQGSIPDKMLGYFERIREWASPFGYDWPATNYRQPKPSCHIAVYSYGEPDYMAYLSAEGCLHEICGLQFICKPSSRFLPEMQRIGRTAPELFKRLSLKVPVIRQ